MKLSLRIKVAIGLGLLGIFSLIGADDAQFQWRHWSWTVWFFLKIAFVMYAAYVLIIDDEEIETLKASNTNSEKLIEELLNKLNAAKTS